MKMAVDWRFKIKLVENRMNILPSGSTGALL